MAGKTSRLHAESASNYCVLHRKLKLETDLHCKYTMSYVSTDPIPDVSHLAVQVIVEGCSAVLCRAAPVVLPLFRCFLHPHIPLKHWQQAILHIQVSVLFQQIIVNILIRGAKFVDVRLLL